VDTFFVATLSASDMTQCILSQGPQYHTTYALCSAPNTLLYPHQSVLLERYVCGPNIWEIHLLGSNRTYRENAGYGVPLSNSLS